MTCVAVPVPVESAARFADPVERDRHLRRLGEWFALGYYEGLALPWPRTFGLAARRFYENVEILIPAAGAILPCQPQPDAHSSERGDRFCAYDLILGGQHNYNLQINPGAAQRKQEQFPDEAAFIDWLVEDLKRIVPPHMGGWTHNNPDIRRVVNEGFDAMEAELLAELAACEQDGGADEELQLLLALCDYTAGVRAFHTRTIAAARAAALTATPQRATELRQIADALAQTFLLPARTFYAGLLALNFTWMLDFCDSIGRVDQALGALYEADCHAGRITEEETQALLAEWFRMFDYFDAWNLQIGGYTPDGRDGCNALTRQIILACGASRLRRPNVAFRVTRQTPPEYLQLAVQALARGTGRPALYNDDLYLDTLLSLPLGLTPEDAREMGYGGCTETMIAGMSNVGSLEGEINLAYVMELAINGGQSAYKFAGMSPWGDAEETAPLGECAEFPAFLAALRAQIRHYTRRRVEMADGFLRRRFTEGNPKLNRTFFTRDCVKNRKSFEAGGARYNWSLLSYQGIPTLIDSLYALKVLAFERKVITPAEYQNALARNFAGDEALLREIAALPKYGNGNSEVDALGAEIVGFAWDELLQCPTPRGGIYMPSVINFATYVRAGSEVGATADGRLCGEPLDDSIGAHAGRDRKGPTALLASVSTLPISKAIGTPVLNVRFPADLLASEPGAAGAAALVRAYFSRGGLQMQLNAVSQKELKEAQLRPEDYQDLIVRLGGYSEYFTRLDGSMQQTIIDRVEHEMR